MEERPPQLAPEMVRDFVIAGHRSLDAVKEMLAAEPGLINATWDWGGGDWETALGGAGHVGQREIALFLLENGARFELYAAAMLGQLAAVQAVIAANPAVRYAPGPHGIPLMAHALRGGEAAAGVVAYLQSLDKESG